MAQIVRLGGNSPSAEKSGVVAPVDPRRGLIIAALSAVIVLAIGTVIYVGWPQTPANIVAGPATPDTNDDSAVFDPKVAEDQQRARQAEQEKEDSAVFGQAPSAPAYQTKSR